MINRIFRLVGIKKIEICSREVELSKKYVLVRPDYLSICAADVRYYFGKRKKEILRKKLPMALIHEGTGSVLYDGTGEFRANDKVVMIPNISGKQDPFIKDNYMPDSRFMSSGTDGFMQDFVAVKKEQLLRIPCRDQVYVLSELLSVAYNALEAFEKTGSGRKRRLGVWGDGNVGFVVALALKFQYPDSVIAIIGKHAKKLQYFSFADESYLGDELPETLWFDHCFECVGGYGTETALGQIFDTILPEGSIALMGVSENSITVPTRVILEKGLVLYGNSRSARRDFERAVSLMRDNKMAVSYLRTIISQKIVVKTNEDIYKAFEQNETNDFKTIMEWSI